MVWASLSFQGAQGRGTKMLRLGSAKPGSWASFWAILTLVGLATRAGEWAVGGGGGGKGREERQAPWALAAPGREGAVSSSTPASEGRRAGRQAWLLQTRRPF